MLSAPPNYPWFIKCPYGHPSKAYDFWIKELGLPGDVAKGMIREPDAHLRRHIEFLGNVRGKKIVNLLGSCGKKAVPLALLGADVTAVDISEQNEKYAAEVERV